MKNFPLVIFFLFLLSVSFAYSTKNIFEEKLHKKSFLNANTRQAPINKKNSISNNKIDITKPSKSTQNAVKAPLEIGKDQSKMKVETKPIEQSKVPQLKANFIDNKSNKKVSFKRSKLSRAYEKMRQGTDNPDSYRARCLLRLESNDETHLYYDLAKLKELEAPIRGETIVINFCEENSSNCQEKTSVENQTCKQYSGALFKEKIWTKDGKQILFIFIINFLY